jgi:hypothetical protein
MIKMLKKWRLNNKNKTNTPTSFELLVGVLKNKNKFI